MSGMADTGIRLSDLQECVIRPTLEHLGLNSRSAVNLLSGTCAQESSMGYFLRQMSGPALGIYQVEPSTHQDVYLNYLKYHPTLLRKVSSLSRHTFEGDASLFSPIRNGKGYYIQESEFLRVIELREMELITNLSYSTAIARMIYYRVREPLPEADDIRGMAVYWKKYYNTVDGKGSADQFVHKYAKHINDIDV